MGDFDSEAWLACNPEIGNLRAAIFDLNGVLRGKRLPRNTVIFCLSLATPLPLARALDVLSQEGMTVRWFCARREAFAEVQERKRDPRSPRVARRFPVPVAQVHPAMRIGRALS